MKPLGIYVHIPFCISKCNYCDFNSYAGLDALHSNYFDALLDEIINKSGSDEYLAETIYIGGGTPTSVKTEYIISVLQALGQRFTVSDNAEITIECNPKTAGYDDFCRLRAAGVNRLSIGLQSACDAQLKKLGRAHNFSDFGVCFNQARKAGFENISLDLMFGLPDQTLDDWQQTLQKAAEFHPEHISCYGLQVEEGTPFANMSLNLPDEEQTRQMYDLCVKLLAANGYDRYEISNFARGGFESRHNLKYWRLDEYAGFGAGAHSFLDGKRFANARGIDDYINGAEFECLPESKEDLMSEFVFLGLRTASGISLDEFERRFDISIDKVYGEAIEKNLARKTLIKKDGRLFLPPDMFFVSNSVLSDFV